MKRLKLSQKDNSILKMLMIDLKGEQDTVELYQKHIDLIENKRVKEVLTHIMEEEKEHISELEELMSLIEEEN